MYTVSNIFLVFCSLLLPLILAVSYCIHNKGKGVFISLLSGVVTFTVFQFLTRIPLIQVVLPEYLPNWQLYLGYFWCYLALGVSAGLFEEFGRYIIMRLFMKKRLSMKNAVAFGIGHGGIEAILLVGINALYYLINSIEVTTPGMMLASGFERLSTMLVHIGFSVMVMKGIKNKKFRWVVIAFALHSIIDTAVLFASHYGLPTFAIEIAIAVSAVAMSVYTIYELKKEKECVTNEEVIC